MSESTAPTVTSLRDIVTARVNVQWSAFAAEHPNLAEVIDRIRIVDSAVTRLRSDPAFQAAMQQAGLDEQQLAAAANILDLVGKWTGRVLRL